MIIFMIYKSTNVIWIYHTLFKHDETILLEIPAWVHPQGCLGSGHLILVEGVKNILVGDSKKHITTTLYMRKTIQPNPLELIKNIQCPLSSYFMYTQIQFF